MKTMLLNTFRAFFKIRFLESWLRKIIQGKDVRSFWAKMTPQNYQYPINSLRHFDYKGIELKLDINDYVAHYLYFGFKDKGHEKLMELVQNGYTVLDIGTNYGTTILQFAKLVGDQGFCYGFEPDPYNFKICQDNLKLNKLKNIVVENLGVGKESAELFLVVDTATNRGKNRISDDVLGREFHKVSIVRIDDWIKSQKNTKIDLVKIDVEGFELNALLGGIETWKIHKPKFFIELDDDNLKLQKASACELVGLMESLGYRIINAETTEVISQATNFSHCHFDIICTPFN